MSSMVETLRAEALFASLLQSSELPAPDEVRSAVTSTLSRLGMRGCDAWVAGEFGDRPEIAVARMTWALATVRAVYPPRSTSAGHRDPESLALAG
jgi:hypothetical protein